MNNFYKVIIASLFFQTVESYNYTQEKRLLDTFQNGDNQIRPILNGTNPIIVTISFSLITVRNLDMKSQAVSSTALISVSWKDEFRKWNKSMYGGIDRIKVSFSKLWQPDLILVNSLGNKNIMEDNEKEVIIESYGQVTWSSEMDLDTTCKVNTTYYPFDVQVFNFNFSKLHSDDSIQENRYSEFNNVTDNFVSNGEWVLMKTKPIRRFNMPLNRNGKTFSDIIWQFEVDRRQTFYVWTFLIPTIAFSSISLISICLPVKSMAKLTISGFSFLAFPVLINIFNSSLPSTSEDNSLFGILLSVNLCLSIIVIIVNCVITIIFHRKCPRCLLPKTIWLCSKCKSCDQKACNCQKRQSTSEYNLRKSHEEYQTGDIESFSQRQSNDMDETELKNLSYQSLNNGSEPKQKQRKGSIDEDQIQVDVDDSKNVKSSFSIIAQTIHNDYKLHKVMLNNEKETMKQWSQVATCLDISLFIVFLLIYGITYAVILVKLFGNRYNLA